MTYSKVERPREHNGGRGFEHEVKVKLNSREDKLALIDLLDGMGKKHEVWRLRTHWAYPKPHLSPGKNIKTSSTNRGYTEAIVRFNSANDAMRFRLMWPGDEVEKPIAFEGFRTGEVHVVSSGRNCGKSILAGRMLTLK